MTTPAVRPSGGHPSRLIAREIRAELGRQQLSNRRLAMQLGVSYAWVNRRVSLGDVDLTFEDVAKIAGALRVPVQRLIGGWIDTGSGPGYTLPRLDSNQQPSGYDTRHAVAA